MCGNLATSSGYPEQKSGLRWVSAKLNVFVSLQQGISTCCEEITALEKNKKLSFNVVVLAISYFVCNNQLVMIIIFYIVQKTSDYHS